MAIFSIPLAEGNQKFTIMLGETRYRLRFVYRNATLGGWFMDIERVDGAGALYSIPLICNCDLMAQFPYKGFGHFWAVIANSKEEYPTFDDMGKNLRLYWSEEAFE